VRGAIGFDEQKVDFLLGDWPMLDALWHHVEFAGRQPYLAGPELNDEISLENEKEIVGLGMRMPDKLALQFDDHHVMPIELRDNLRGPVLRKGAELLAKTDGCRHG